MAIVKRILMCESRNWLRQLQVSSYIQQPEQGFVQWSIIQTRHNKPNIGFPMDMFCARVHGCVFGSGRERLREIQPVIYGLFPHLWVSSALSYILITITATSWLRFQKFPTKMKQFGNILPDPTAAMECPAPEWEKVSMKASGSRLVQKRVRAGWCVEQGRARLLPVTLGRNAGEPGEDVPPFV